jgi:isoaspartyl peptidase/L-asparaginase-like protein (Ntn-hydrolase superfamily)
MSKDRARWAIVLHGGAKTIAFHRREANQVGCLSALAAGVAALRSAGAVAAVETAIRVLESDPTFNAGRGSVLNADGDIEMDAAIMDGANLNVGAVAALRSVRHPITVARLLLRETPVLLTAEGARRFAADHGVQLCDQAALIVQDQKPGVQDHNGCDTVGCVALDMAGNLASGTSTGGLAGCHPGRVGDSPLPGCGLYADNNLGGVAFSGDGEYIARMILAARVMQELEASSPQKAVERAIDRLKTIGGEAGGIALDRRGRVGWAHNSEGFAVALHTSAMDRPKVFLHKNEDI